MLVDVERGRTVKGWRPRRLGGGLGNTRRGGPEQNTKYSGRDDFSSRDRNVPEREAPVMRGTSPPPDRDRYRRNERSRSRDRRRRSRSRDRDATRRRRSRERAPAAGGEREIKKEPVDEAAADGLPVNPDHIKRERRSRERSNRSRSRDRKRRRSRSRERRGGSKSRDRRRGDREAGAADGGNVFVKQELEDGGDYGVGADGAAPNYYQNQAGGQFDAQHGAIDPSNY